MKFLPSFLQKQSAQTQPTSTEEIQHIRLQILNNILVVASIMGTIAYFTNISSLIQSKSWITAAVQAALVVAVIGLTVYERAGYRLRSTILLGAVFLLAMSDLMDDGLPGEGRMFLMVYALLTLVLLPFRQALVGFIFSTLALVAVAVLSISGVLPPPDMTQFDGLVIANWVTGVVVYLLMALLTLYALNSVTRGLEKGFAEQKLLSTSLEVERNTLEENIDQRTAELRKRTEDMEISSQFSQTLSQIDQTTEILEAGRNCFQEKLEYNSMLFYLINEKLQTMEIKLAAGEQPEAVQTRQPVITPNLPGTFASLSLKGEPRLLRNNGDDAIYFQSGLVEKMYTAVLLPLKKANQVTGFILLFDEQHREIDASEIRLYMNIADQISRSVDRSRLLDILQQSVEDLKTSSRQATQYSWRSYLKATRRKTSYRYNREGIQEHAPETDTTIQALKSGKVIIAPEADETKEMVTLAMPIILRGQPLGVINLRMDGSSVPEDMTHLVESVSNRLALALENARLVEEVQQRAEREAAVGTISGRVRASNDIDGILKVAAQEIGRSLGVSEVIVQLRNE